MTKARPHWGRAFVVSGCLPFAAPTSSGTRAARRLVGVNEQSNEVRPLSERVDAPAVAPVPVHADVATWRPATVDDVDAIAQLTTAVELVDHPTWSTPREGLKDTFEVSYIDPATDTLLGFAHDGTLVAYGRATRSSTVESRVQAYAMGSIHPEWRGRGIGRQLMAWSLARAQQHLAASESTLPGWVIMYTEESNTAAIRLGECAGLSVERYFTTMQRDLALPIPEIQPPADVALIQFTPEFAEATRLAHNDAFRDHWGSQPSGTESWAKFVGGEVFRADLSWLAVEDAPGADDAGPNGKRVVAYALASVNHDDWALQGFSSTYIDLIGVARHRRGQKLAPAVIAAQLRGAAAAGLERAILDVDTASPTGAHTLYTGMGFVATEREVALVLAY